MKITKISDTDYKIYIYTNIIDEEKIINEVKTIIKKLQIKLKIKGFYHVNTYYDNNGLFLSLIKMEDAYYKNSLDLRIVLNEECNIYFKTRDYFILDNLNVIKYYDGYYYGLMDDSFDRLIEKVEFGDIVFGRDIDDLLDKAIVI